MSNEKDTYNAETDYMQENIDALLEREKEKDAKIINLEKELTTKERTIK